MDSISSSLLSQLNSLTLKLSRTTVSRDRTFVDYVLIGSSFSRIWKIWNWTTVDFQLWNELRFIQGIGQLKQMDHISEAESSETYSRHSVQRVSILRMPTECRGIPHQIPNFYHKESRYPWNGKIKRWWLKDTCIRCQPHCDYFCPMKLQRSYFGSDQWMSPVFTSADRRDS